MGNLEAEIYIAVEDIASEDKNMCLFSLSKAEAADVRLPAFSGNKEEVIETKSADGDIEGLSRLGCEQGFPKYLPLDQERTLLATWQQWKP